MVVDTGIPNYIRAKAICMCMYIYRDAYMYIYIHIHIHAHVHIYIYTHIDTYATIYKRTACSMRRPPAFLQKPQSKMRSLRGSGDLWLKPETLLEKAGEKVREPWHESEESCWLIFLPFLVKRELSPRFSRLSETKRPTGRCPNSTDGTSRTCKPRICMEMSTVELLFT